LESVENNAVVNGAHILLFEKHSLCAAFYDSVDVVFCKLGSTVNNHVVALDRNHLACGGIGIILKPALHDTSGQLATDHSLEIRFRHLDLFGKVKYLYDVFAYDSPLEKDNIIADIEEVVVYSKIPRNSIAIPTITGSMYSPDFMYLIRHKDGRQELNLVVETKDYEHDASLRLEEKYRIECAKAFFQSLKEDGFNVEYREQLRNDKIINIIKNIIAI